MTYLPKHPYRPQQRIERPTSGHPPLSVPGLDLARAVVFVLVASAIVRLVLAISEAEPLAIVVRMQ